MDMKIIKLIGWGFAVFGLVFVVVGAGIYYSDSQFAARALKAKGVVTDMVRPERNSTSYSAIVRFTDAQGQQQEMADKMSSNPPRFSRGEEVDVLYDPQSPSNAMIDDAFGRYFLPGMFSGLGAVIATMGVAILVVSAIRKRGRARLLRFGRPVEAEFLEVFRDQKITVNGTNPFRVAAQAKDPTTGQLRRYESHTIWVDPSAQLEGRKVKVMVDPAKPSRYAMDLSDVVPEQV
ncbi:DUF3592 domain-containing protein [Agrobacterium larrymoorei]|uniref:DUF3592 domain-containing protein n=1 Tax=Agrobacterium larrymoorei TaxID=160699 RepID=A0AAF0HC28_9HYPH|nr:DUF3592 domain-containing protein [Agrobacterium larrymoorei]WHA41735.1 DUF3592 domain-containing protein [Agrobacterium larrymoorei]